METVTNALFQSFHLVMGPFFELLPEDDTSRIMQECYFIYVWMCVFIHHHPVQTGLFFLYVVIHTHLRNTSELIQNLIAPL